MRIRPKIILIVLPLLIAPLVFTGVAASLAARNGITLVATGFLRFKAEELLKYSQGQWSLLEANDLAGDPQFLDAARSSVAAFAGTLIRSPTELILAVDETGALVMQTGPLRLSTAETDVLARLAAGGSSGWSTLRLGGVERVAQTVPFEPLRRLFLVTEERETFYRSVLQIYWQSGAIVAVTLAVTLSLLLLFSGYLTGPLRSVVGAMREIIASGDLSRRVDILYDDETGELGHTFNLMTDELEKAYGHVKGYALRAAVAERKERKIRNIFQRYVPREVINLFDASPESMLVGEDRVLAILFSDVRGFTTISERLSPAEMVESLNRYFGAMVDIVMGRDGIVDKYIGDAILAFFGAPVKHHDDPQQALRAAFEMLAALEDFNAWQETQARPRFNIGIGINYGVVTVGNIGSEKKLDYTVIGDTVNVASRIEALTKLYREPIIISEAMHRYVMNEFPCRQIDRVAVKGREKGIAIYAPRRTVGPQEERAWALHHAALQHYYNQEFDRAAPMFRQVMEQLPEDGSARLFADRAEALAMNSPPDGWTGVITLTEK